MKPPLVPTPRSQRGFSLEIISLCLAGFALIGAVVMNTDKCFCSSPSDTAKTFIECLKPVMMKYRMDMGTFPSSEQGLQSLQKLPAGAGKNWQGPYVDTTKDLFDPWKQHYLYRSPGFHNPDSYDVWSRGPDGISGTSDDIGNWKSP